MGHLTIHAHDSALVMIVPLFILSIFLIYIKMPFDVIRLAMIDLIPGIDHKKWKTYGTIPWLESTMSKTDPESINKLFKLFEQFGEALPQFFLALTYFIANYNFVWQSEDELKMFGFYTGVPSTLISIVLSAGSITIGIVTGVLAGKKVCLAKGGESHLIKAAKE